MQVSRESREFSPMMTRPLSACDRERKTNAFIRPGFSREKPLFVRGGVKDASIC